MIEVKGLTFTYAGADVSTLKEVSLTVREGDFLLMVGKSGCGKSTLCRAMNGLIPHFYGGEMAGRVLIDGMDTRETTPAKLAERVGTVFQDPENQLVMTNVENEMAFGMENMGLPREEMKARVRQYAEYFDLSRFLHRFIPELSGGEKQKVALGSVLAMRPSYLILDEPTSQLDTKNAILFLDFLARLNKEFGVAVILVEHRLERCLQFARRVVYMEKGRILLDCDTDQAVRYLGDRGLLPAIAPRSDEIALGHPVVKVDSLSFAYDHVPVLSDLNLRVARNEILAITGSNGSGKSTLLKNIMGLLKPGKGKVEALGEDVANTTPAKLARRVGFLGQNPNDYLFEETLQKELEFTLKNLKIEKKEWDERIRWALEMVDLVEYREHFPRDLSCGERERAALASILVGRPEVLILDEPTRGLDQWNKNKLGEVLEGLRNEGITTILVTHDFRFVAEHATRVAVLKDGQVRDVPLDSFLTSLGEEMKRLGGMRWTPS